MARTATVRRGRFVQTLQLRADQLPAGARVFAGGFVLSATGRIAAGRLPLQLRTIVVPSPDEGVVRSAFASGVDGVPQPKLPASTTVAVANFQFAHQPRSRLGVSVTWYWPDGRRQGTIRKPNYRNVRSELRSTVPLPPGAWTAELRAGGKVVKRLRVQVG